MAAMYAIEFEMASMAMTGKTPRKTLPPGMAKVLKRAALSAGRCDTCRRQPRVKRQVVDGKARPGLVVRGDRKRLQCCDLL
jgi:hypothetical protein